MKIRVDGVDMVLFTGERLESLNTYQIAYRKFLATPQWDELRSECYHRAGHRCARCKHGGRQLNAHHHTYPERWEDTTQEHLECICRGCHEQHHGISPRNGKSTGGSMVVQKAPGWKRRDKQERKKAKKLAKKLSKLIYKPSGPPMSEHPCNAKYQPRKPSEQMSLGELVSARAGLHITRQEFMAGKKRIEQSRKFAKSQDQSAKQRFAAFMAERGLAQKEPRTIDNENFNKDGFTPSIHY